MRTFFGGLRQRFGRFNIGALRAFQRFAPSEQQRVFLLTLVIGAACGLAAVAFHVTIIYVERWLIEPAFNAPPPYWMALAILTPAVGGVVAGVLLYYFVPDARGSGIPQVKVAYAVKDGRIPARVAIGKFVIGVIQIGTGAALGREGPTVQICAGISSIFGQAAALSRRNRRLLLPVGAAAGIAAAFNAPIAAVTFTIEEIIGDLDQTVLSGVIVAAALAAAIERGLLGAEPVLVVPQGYTLNHVDSLVLYALLGVAAAVISIAFSDSLLNLRLWFQRLAVVPPWAKPGIGAGVTGALAVAALVWFNSGGITGGGYGTLSEILAGKVAFQALAALCVMKLLATVFSYSSGGAGGIFAPALFIGGALGGLFGYLDVAIFNHETVEIGAFALVGMGAAFAGIIRAPITSVLIIFELTGGYGLILPLMIANTIAYVLARRWRELSVYEGLLEQDGVHLPHNRSAMRHALERVRVGEAMTSDVQTLSAITPVEQALQEIDTSRFTSFPVLDERQHFVGLVSNSRLRRTIADGGGDHPVGEVTDRRTPLFADQPLIAAMVQMNKEDSHELAVVDRRDPTLLTGILSMSDIVRTQARVALENGGANVTSDMSEVRETLTDRPGFLRLRAFRGGEGNERTNGETGSDVRYHLVQIAEESPSVGQQVRDLHLPEGVLLVTIDRGNRTLLPRGETVLRPGDKVTIFANVRTLPQALAMLAGEEAAEELRIKEGL